MDPNDDKGKESEQLIIDVKPPKRPRSSRTSTPPTGDGQPTEGLQVPGRTTRGGVSQTDGEQSNTDSRIQGQINTSIGTVPPEVGPLSTDSRVPDIRTVSGVPRTGAGQSNRGSRNQSQVNTSISIAPHVVRPSNKKSRVRNIHTVSGVPSAGAGPSNTDSRIQGQITTSNAGRECVQLSIMCAHNLHNLRLYGKMNPRAVILIDRIFADETSIHFEGGTHPYWREMFNLGPESEVSQFGTVTIQLHDCVSDEERPLIGYARVSVPELTVAYGGTEFLPYMVWTPAITKFQGLLHVTVRRVPQAAETGHAAHD